MAAAHPGIDSFIKYLKNSFPWKKDWDASHIVGETFKYGEIKEAMRRLKTTDPTLHRMFGYRWQSNRSRNEIANSLYMDPSTLKRNWDKATNIVVNMLVNRDVVADLEQIDLILMD